MDELPSNFDLIVIGTGLTESIVAAAASRIGKTVLHLDSNDYYGNSWASFNLQNIQQLQNDAPEEIESRFDPFTYTLKMRNAKNVENFEQSWFDFTQGDVNGWNKESILKEFRRFNIDLCPKLLFCRGSMVELLISSNISRYAEFRACDRVATVKDAIIKTVPCSRADVFTNKDVNVVEKRILMKILTACTAVDSEEFKDLQDKTFLEVLKIKKLTPNLIHYVLYAIAMSSTSTSCSEGVESVRKFLSSLGRFGNTPFLFPMYGSGEIPQCFCRLCAVFGGIYCLSTPIETLYFHRENDEIVFEGVLYDTKKITAKNIILGHGSVSKGIFFEEKQTPSTTSCKCGGLSRGIFITSTPIGGFSQNTGGGGVMFLKLPPPASSEDSDCNGAYIIQLSHTSGTVPKNLFLIHITCENSTSPKDDIQPYLQQILKREASTPVMTPSDEGTEFTDETVLDKDTIPTILWSCYFNIPTCIKCQQGTSQAPPGVKLTCGPFFELDFDLSIQQAKDIFADLYPENEFLPRAPDPDEIVCEGEDATAPKVEIDPLLIEQDRTDNANSLPEKPVEEENIENSEEVTG